MGVRRGASSHPRPLIIARAGLERASRRRRRAAVISRTCGITTIKLNLREFVAPPPRHRRDACSMAWRCQFITTCTHALQAGPSTWETTSPARSARRCLHPSAGLLSSSRTAGPAAPSRRTRCASGASARAGPGGRACVCTVRDAPRIESQASDGKGPRRM